MAYNLKEVIANKPSRFTAGHRMCAGCGAPVVGLDRLFYTYSI